ncbi:transcription factor GTE1 isoform X1 [Rhododendron vialii]|uniref:transcription factor GTE1 isoform X1 n=1 Tax=Rhododendron vialii TaxID=182163 RepID=UPI00265E4738|nr:transcription factor GTE1 isoform X1 [Rhododendron vialii]XP_058211323.1 transcription factor GTE1 isoform X1 [Rhododendron vialii]
MDLAIPDNVLVDQGKAEGNDADMEDFRHHVDEISTKVDKLEQTLNEVEQFYSTTGKKQLNTSKGTSVAKDKDKHIANFKKRQQDASLREAAATKRMQELMRQFGTILRQITQHKWAGPFMQPVDVVGLGLHDYYEVIEKPMDFTTIKSKMEAKDGSAYKNVREMCADVRLIFKNAMKYNEERDDVHVMAKTLLAKFEEKWLQLLPKVDEEFLQEKRRKEEEAEAQIDMQLAQEAAHAKMARDLSDELDEVDLYLEELREMVLQKCRRMTTEEKRRLGTALTRLSPDDLQKALLIVAENNPGFQATAEEVDLDIDAQSESTLWRLKFFVKEALQVQGKSAASTGDTNHNNDNNKRKREICDALAKTSQKRSKKLP